MTKEQLEKMKECLVEYSRSTHDTSGGMSIHDCCLGRLIHEKSYPTDKGHTKDCVVMECIKIVEKEMYILETEENNKFSESLKYP